MPYASLENLSRFHGRLKGYALENFAGMDMANWQKTETAGAVSFSPVPEMPLDPVVNFLFTETGPASGEKGPDNPSTITGVTQAKVTRCGKNLISPPYHHASGREYLGITYTLNPDGSLVCNGTSEGYSSFIYAYNKFLPVGTYTLSGCPSGGNSSTTYSLAIQRRAGATYQDYGNGVTFEVQEPDFYYILASVKPGYVANNLVFSPPQLELGSTATSFEPYDGADYTVNLGGTFYGGSVDLSTGVMTVTVGYSEISSFTNFVVAKTTTVCFDAALAYGHPTGGSGYTMSCQEFEYGNANSSTVDTECWRPWGGGGVNGAYFNILKSRLDVSGAADPSNPTNAEWLAAANAWVSSHKIHCVAQLYTPFTIQLTPTQIYSLSQPDPYTPSLNTVYSDQVSVQVGYPKSPQASQTELTNAIVSLGGNV